MTNLKKVVNLKSINISKILKAYPIYNMKNKYIFRNGNQLYFIKTLYNKFVTLKVKFDDEINEVIFNNVNFFKVELKNHIIDIISYMIEILSKK